MIEMMKKARAKNKVCSAILIHLSKVFDCLKHDLFIAKIAKLNAFGFSCKSL